MLFRSKTGEFKFEKTSFIERDFKKLDGLLLELDVAVYNSELPEKSDPEVYNNYLIKIRKEEKENNGQA